MKCMERQKTVSIQKRPKIAQMVNDDSPAGQYNREMRRKARPLQKTEPYVRIRTNKATLGKYHENQVQRFR